MARYDARIFREPQNWALDLVRLAIREERTPGTGGYLMPDGTWKVVAEGEAVGDIGILIPSESVEALAVAIAEFQGHASHGDTEARVLREWLASERERVDKVLNR